MDFLPPEPAGFWTFRLAVAVASVAAMAGFGLIANSDLATFEGMASAAGGAALIALSLAGFLYYWRSI